MDFSPSSSESFAPLLIQLPSAITQSQMVKVNLSGSGRSFILYLYLHECSNGNTYYAPLQEFLNLLTEMLPGSKGVIESKKRHLHDSGRRPAMQNLQIFATYERNIVVKAKRNMNLVGCEFLSCSDILTILKNWSIPASDYIHITNCLQHFLMGYIQAKALAWLVLISNLFL
jgi:hypothetical protein